jgi:uncharacterized damage-inducible protein DinB
MTTGMALTHILREEAEATYAITERLFREVADSELSWRPATGSNWMTVGQLLMHCASFGCGKAVRGFVRGDWDFPEEPGEADHMPPPSALPSVGSVDEALGLLARDRELAIGCIDEAQEADLLGARFAAPWGGPEFTQFQHLSLMIAHLGQHKGQLFYYLKLMGRDLNTADLWGA